MTWVFQLNAPSCTDEPANNLLAYTGTLNNDECNRYGDKPGWFILKETRADVSLPKSPSLKTSSAVLLLKSSKIIIIQNSSLLSLYLPFITFNYENPNF